MDLRTLAWLALAPSLFAQQFAPRGGHPPDSVVPARAYTVLAFGDADGDGDDDFVANDPVADAFVLVRSTGAGGWTTTGLLPPVVTAAAWGDFDGDGDLDVVIGGGGVVNQAPIGILRNDGAAFTWLGQIAGVAPGTVRQLVVGDVDGDLDVDLVVATAPAGLQLFRNQGPNTLVLDAPAIPTPQPDPRAVLFDRDGDGDLDLAAANGNGVALFDNVGGSFVDVSATLPPGARGTRIAAADFDGDGRVDLAVSSHLGVDVLWNDVAGITRQAGVVPPVSAEELLLADLDRNGRPDLVVQGQLEVDWIRNDGNRAFSRLAALRRGFVSYTRAVAVGDPKGRGADDVVCTWRDGAPQALFAGAPAPFTDPNEGLPDMVGETACAGDLDADGWPDAVVCLFGRVDVLHNEGRGRFTIRAVPSTVPGAREPSLADLDGDNRPDLLLASYGGSPLLGGSLQLLRNDGAGGFQALATHSLPQPPYGVGTGDVDGDGDVDVVVTAGLGVRLLQNRGVAGFVDVGPLPGIVLGNPIDHLVFEDVDGDSDPDLLLIRYAVAEVAVFTNDGLGTFTASTPVPLAPGTFPNDVVATDVDRDGDLDVVVNEYPATGPVLFVNGGTGAFTRANAAFPAFPFQPGGLAVGDLDGDGAPDLLLGGAVLLHNDGTGVFRDETARLTSTPLANAVWADFDRDGDEDLLHRTSTAPAAQRMTITENRLRGAASLQTVRPGGQLQVRFHVNPLPPVAASLVLPLAAFAPGAAAAIPGFAGSLLLPPQGTAVLGALVVTNTTALLAIAIPPSATFVGFDVSVQGLVLGAGLQPGFTNVVDERILP